MFSSPVRRPTISRPVAFGGGLALAALLVVPSVATAAPSASASLNGDTLHAAVTGTNPRVGMWRLRVVAPDASQRIDFIVQVNDTRWSGTVKVSRRVDGRWATASQRFVAGNEYRLRQASGSAAGVRWDTSRFRLPSNGNGRFAIAVELTRSGSYKVVGFVRLAREAFVYGSWKRADSRVIEH